MPSELPHSDHTAALSGNVRAADHTPAILYDAETYRTNCRADGIPRTDRRTDGVHAAEP